MYQSHEVEPHGVEVIGIGTSAPDFLLSSDTDPPRRLTDFRGQPVVIAFYPPDWDPARDEQIALYNRLMENLPGAHAQLLGIAIEGAWCRLCCRGGEERVPLLSDFDSTGAIARGRRRPRRGNHGLPLIRRVVPSLKRP